MKDWKSGPDSHTWSRGEYEILEWNNGEFWVYHGGEPLDGEANSLDAAKQIADTHRATYMSEFGRMLN